MRKIKNKKKRLFKFLGVIILLSITIYIILNIKIKNIYVKGNNILSDYEIIELAGISNYPKLFSVSSKKIENKIKMNQLIKSVNVSKNIFGRIDINVEEYNILLKDEIDNGVYISNNKKITLENIAGIPSLINIVDEKVLNEFLTKLNTIDRKILSKISEIEYTPSEFDNELFLFYMNDGNYVYINILRLSNINKYESVLEQLSGKKGILYLDSGNHFEIIE